MHFIAPAFFIEQKTQHNGMEIYGHIYIYRYILGWSLSSRVIKDLTFTAHYNRRHKIKNVLDLRADVNFFSF